jgi:hypothetical protein
MDPQVSLSYINPWVIGLKWVKPTTYFREHWVGGGWVIPLGTRIIQKYVITFVTNFTNNTHIHVKRVCNYWEEAVRPVLVNKVTSLLGALVDILDKVHADRAGDGPVGEGVGDVDTARPCEYIM